MKPVLTRGCDDCEDIKILQRLLHKLLPEEIEDNGHFGHYTESRVKKFQKEIGLSQDGQVDEIMWEAMLSKLAFLT